MSKNSNTYKTFNIHSMTPINNNQMSDQQFKDIIMYLKYIAVAVSITAVVIFRWVFIK